MQGELAGHDMMLGDGVIEQGLKQRGAFQRRQCTQATILRLKISMMT